MRETIELAAGQALNEEIARRVFGRRIPTQSEMRECARRVWQTQPAVQFFSDLGGFHVEPMNEAAAQRPYRKDDARFVASVPDYSRRIADAWSIVDAFAKRGILLMLEQCHHQEIDLGDDESTDILLAEKGQWVAYFQDVITRGKAGADTPALAISLAALAAAHPHRADGEQR